MKRMIIGILVCVSIIVLFKNNRMESYNIYDYEIKEVSLENEKNKIYGVLYKPKTLKKVPIIIYSHGLGGNHNYGNAYAQEFVEKGYAFYTFDFCGGSFDSKSDGLTTEMSVITEMSDLEAVLKSIKKWDFIDQNNITFFGTSQGGLVSSQVAIKHEKEIKNLILFYPAFVIEDDIHIKYPTKEDVPKRTNYRGWIDVSDKYMLDIYDLDFYDRIKNYQKEVLIVHGNQDSIVPLEYSKKLDQVYVNSYLKIIKGAGHGFYGEAFDEAIEFMNDYLNRNEESR